MYKYTQKNIKRKPLNFPQMASDGKYHYSKFIDSRNVRFGTAKRLIDQGKKKKRKAEGKTDIKNITP